ncbi:MAG: endolytic transglycosylase MltG [Methylovulum sp.]|nr:endolytic transglycosylase MltG [Methylovulum sp.]
MSGNKIIGAALLFLALSCVGIAGSYRHALQRPVVTGDSVTIEIEKGDSFNRIGDKLIAANLSINLFWFKVHAVRQQAFNKLKAGEYELTKGLTIPEVLTIFVHGKTKQYAITFPEGWKFKQVLQAIASNPQLEHTINGSDDAELMLKLGATVGSPEGEFFPDTYFFEKHTTDIALLKRAYDKMQSAIQAEWLKRSEKLPFKSPYEALILASIIEKETAAPAEREMIAGVFIRRLQQNMLLQTDPTVIYGMGEEYVGNIAYEDLRKRTPYNTYLSKGLPPTPIAMPGREAIVAALHPDNSDSLYFVARGDGTHVFSATLKSHNLAVEKFQRKKNDAR